MKIKNFLNPLIAIFVISACTMAPKYKQPEVEVPFAAPTSADKQKISTISWKQYFQSPDLQRVIQLALDNNRDLRVANLNIEVAQGTHGVARSNLMPTISAVGSETRQGVPSAFAGFTPKKQFGANLTLTSYEVDFFGRLRSLKKSALEDFLASEETRNVTKITVIAETVNAYAQLLLDSKILKITEENLKAQSNRFNFTELRYKNGIDSQVDLLAAAASIETAKTTFETYKKLVAQDKNALMVLTGTFDEKALPQDTELNDIRINEELLDLVPSESLLLRPDVQQAEHSLKSANANIGAARAAFFPSITLTGTYGYRSRELDGLFDSKTWTFMPQINLPIFSGGRNLANLSIANARKKVQIAQYEKAIQTAFREALDQFAEKEAISNQLKSYDTILSAREKSNIIYEAKHKVGISSALNVLDAQIAFLTAKQNQASAKKEYITNLVNLYKVLGGGAELEEVVAEDKKK